MHIVAEAQKPAGGSIIRCRHALDVNLCQEKRCQYGRPPHFQPNTGEQALEIAERWYAAVRWIVW